MLKILFAFGFEILLLLETDLLEFGGIKDLVWLAVLNLSEIHHLLLGFKPLALFLLLGLKPPLLLFERELLESILFVHVCDDSLEDLEPLMRLARRHHI